MQAKRYRHADILYCGAGVAFEPWLQSESLTTRTTQDKNKPDRGHAYSVLFSTIRTGKGRAAGTVAYMCMLRHEGIREAQQHMRLAP